MKIKHFFVPVLDVNEIIPFHVKVEKEQLTEIFAQFDEAKRELSKFIDLLEKNFGESIYYMGMDIICEKSYERFMFANGGFLEVLVEAPLAINAHFVNDKRAKKFAEAIKKTFKKILPESPTKQIFIDSIEAQNERDTSLSVNKWNKLKEIRGC